MSKLLKVCMVVGLMVAIATPALAEFKFNGYFRTQGYQRELKSTTDDDGDSQAFMLQRFRAKLTYDLNENVSVVYFGEVDSNWGQQSKGALGGGGELGSDGVNVETKNVYVDTKFGDTKARLGIQGLKDNYEGIVYWADMAAVNVTHQINDFTLTARWSKWYEDDRSDWDDTDIYLAGVAYKFNENLKIGFDVHYLDSNNFNNKMSARTGIDGNPPGIPGIDNDKDDLELFIFGPHVDWSFNKFNLNGFVVVETGEVENSNSNAQEPDVDSWLASAKMRYMLDNGDLGLRVIYSPEADDDSDYEGFVGDLDQYAFVNENQMIFLVDKYVTEAGKEQYAINDSLEQGFGLAAIIASGNHKLPKEMYLHWGAGYYMAADDTSKLPQGEVEVDDEDLGFELSARIGKKFLGNRVDVSLNSAYADFGDFYEDSVDTNGDGVGDDDPDGIYKTYLMVNVPW